MPSGRSEAVVQADPSFRPSSSEVSPRLLTAFTDVRKRMLPTIVQAKYATAKAAFDRKEWKAAEARFPAGDSGPERS